MAVGPVSYQLYAFYDNLTSGLVRLVETISPKGKGSFPSLIDVPCSKIECPLSLFGVEKWPVAFTEQGSYWLWPLGTLVG